MTRLPTKPSPLQLRHAPPHATGYQRGVRGLVLDESLDAVVELLAALSSDDTVLLGGPEHELAPAPPVATWHADVGAVPSVVFRTSGSSGEPKLVCHSHSTLATALDHTLAMRDAQLGGAAPALTVVPGMPLWSISGFSVLGLTLCTGGHVVLGDPTSPAAMLDTIERHEVNNLGVPPILLRGLVREQRRRPRATDSLLLIGVGAGPVDAALARDAEQVLGCLIATVYGSTEVGGAALHAAVRRSARRAHRLGRARIAGIEIAVDATGELLVRTDSLMRGYIDASGELVPQAREGWYATGDLATIDDAGNVHILGRVDDQILRGGRLIDPVPIEAALERHRSVQRAAVVGVPSRVPGEQDLWAACVLVSGAPTRAPRPSSSSCAASRFPRRAGRVASCPCPTSRCGVTARPIARRYGSSCRTVRRRSSRRKRRGGVRRRRAFSGRSPRRNATTA